MQVELEASETTISVELLSPQVVACDRQMHNCNNNNNKDKIRVLAGLKQITPCMIDVKTDLVPLNHFVSKTCWMWTNGQVDPH